ncbi:MAG: polymer-forming cytoskeletal protein [Sneathiella sp.]|nr:polymer-forming cytoskeletal protein [Sneathiella sp.]
MFSGSNNKKSKSNESVNGTPSILSKGLVITGNLVSDGELQIEGIVVGDIAANKLSIGETAHVTGSIDANEVLIRGKVDGGIKGVNVSILASASVKGDVINSTLSIESGAIIDGHCKHSDNPRDVSDPIALFDKAEAAKTE